MLKPLTSLLIICSLCFHNLDAQNDLELSHGLKIGDNQSAEPGSIRFNSATSHFEGYNGIDWVRLDLLESQSWVDSVTFLYRKEGRVGIGTDNPAESAQLEVHAIDKGMLLPRLTTTQRDLIPDPAEGLMIFNTTDRVINFFFNGGWYATSALPSTTLPEIKMPGYTMLVLEQDEVDSARWSYQETLLNTLHPDGELNSTLIQSQLGVDSLYAANYCMQMDTLGYDWYLPSIEELDSLYAHHELVGGFQNVEYWSSTTSGKKSNYDLCNASCQQQYVSCVASCDNQRAQCIIACAGDQSCIDQCNSNHQTCVTSCGGNCEISCALSTGSYYVLYKNFGTSVIDSTFTQMTARKAIRCVTKKIK